MADPGGPGPPLIFRPSRGPNGQKNFFGRPPPLPPLSQGLDPALITVVEAFEKVKKSVISVQKGEQVHVKKSRNNLQPFLKTTSTQKMGIRT